MKLETDVDVLIKILRQGQELHISQDRFDFAFRQIAHICGYHKVAPETLGDWVETRLETENVTTPLKYRSGKESP